MHLSLEVGIWTLSQSVAEEVTGARGRRATIAISGACVQWRGSKFEPMTTWHVPAGSCATSAGAAW